MVCKKSENDKDKQREDDELFDSLDAQTRAFLRDYLSITDEDLKAHVRRLVEEIRLNPKKKKT
jgi:hypothetical protein